MLMLKSATDAHEIAQFNTYGLETTPIRHVAWQQGQLHIDCISDDSDFLTLESEWDALFSAAGSDQHVFQSFAWLHHWYTIFVKNGGPKPMSRLAIVTGRVNGKLVMVWPLVEKRSFGVKTIEWMGAPVSQYGDVVLAQGPDQKSWVAAGLKYIKTHLKPDALVLHNVREDSQLARQGGNLKLMNLGVEQAPYLDLSHYQSFADFRASYSKRTRKTRSRKRRRLMEMPGVTAEVLTPGPRAKVVSRATLKIKRQWLEGRNVVSRAFSTAQIDAFMNRVVSAKERSVQALVTAISIDGQLIAGEVGFRNQKTYFSHVAAYDLDHARLSAGVLQFEDTVAHCIENGIQTIDLLAPADPYKLEWATGTISVDKLAMPCTLKGYVSIALNSGLMRRWMRRCAAWLPKSIRNSVAGTVTKVL